MTRIKGLNDNASLNSSEIKHNISVWKGEKRGAKTAGKNLKDKFRVEAAPTIRNKIAEAYGAEERQGSLYVDRLNLIPACGRPLETFTSKMAAFTASRPLHFCDREQIYLKFNSDEQNYFQPQKVAEPCPVAGTNHKCPKNCEVVGNFYFYIYELLVDGYSDIARLQVGGIEDNRHIAGKLDAIAKEIGSIKQSPFSSYETRTYIIYQLTRRAVQSKYPILDGDRRTQKRGTKEDWIVNLNLHPLWLEKYNSYRQMQEIKALNLKPSLKLIEQVHGTDAIEISGSAYPPLLASHPQSSPHHNLEEFKKELAIAFKNNGWDKQGALAMMRSYFQTSEVTSNLDLELLLSIARSAEEKDKWCEF